MRRTLNALLISRLISCAAALISPTAAMAEAKTATAPPGSAPETFGDWTLRCGMSPDGTTRACEIDSWITAGEQKQPIAQIAFGRPLKTPEKKPDADKAGKDKASQDKASQDKLSQDKPAAADAKSDEAVTRLIVLVPVNMTIAPGIEVVVDTAKPHLTMPVKTCIPAACLAQIELTGEQLQAFRNRSEPGQIIFTDPAGKPVTIAVSFKGLDQALDSLAKQ
jgi:invasion protein IalB